MPITDLHDRVPFPLDGAPRAGAATADRPDAPARPAPSSGDGAPSGSGRPGPSLRIERPAAEGPRLQIVALDALDTVDLDAPPAPSPPEEPAAAPPTPPAPAAPRPPLPSWGIAAIGALALLSIALTAALAASLTGPDTATRTGTEAPAEAPADVARPAAPSPASFPADPSPIPVDLLTRLEEASDEPLDVELSRLLDAVQHGFGRRSAQLDPTLRSYVYRMSSRFEWNPDTFRVAVTAPDPALAAARAALLERLFEGAVAAGRLDVGTGVGPDALTLVTE